MEQLHKLLVAFLVFYLDGIVICADKEFKSYPTTVKTHENDTVLLPCYLDNAGSDYQVRWLKDGKVIVDTSDQDLAPPFRVRLYSNHSLQVIRVQPGDTGEYVCEIIRTEPWSPIRQVHAIEVLLPPSIVPIPESGVIEVRLGDDVDIGCKANGVPQPYISWLNKGEPLELLVNRARLKFKATSRHLAGNYDCVANNGVGESAKATIQVVILHPPEVEPDNHWVHTAIGLRAQLQCRVTASPAAKVHWFFGHKPIITNSRIISHTKGDVHALVIRNVHKQDLGMYVCKAENRIGMTEARLHLSGVANIATFKADAIKNHPTPTTFTLMWEVDSYSPIIEYNLWFRPYKPKPPQKEGVFIKDNDDTWMKLTIPGEVNEGPVHTGMYVIRGLSPSTVYEALVTSRNRFGWSKPSAIFHFATSGVVTEQPVSTEDSLIQIPVLEEETDLISLYSTPILEENIIPRESNMKSGAEKLFSLNIYLLGITIYLKIFH